MITHRERLLACLAGERPDRLPVALWRHFPVDDQTPEGLAAATLAFQNTFDFDLIKVTPASSFCLKDWGAQDQWRGATEGTRDYTLRVIQHPDDWARLRVLDPLKGFLAQQITCLELIRDQVTDQTPVLQTIFSPLSQAKNLVGGERLLVHLRQHPEALHRGLEIITTSTLRFIEAALSTGIAGIFFAVQHAQYGLLGVEEFKEFGSQYDVRILNQTQDLWLNMVHLHGREVMFPEVSQYPAQILNWHDQETAPSLADGQTMFPQVVCGGVSRENGLVLGTAQQIREEVNQAIGTTGGRRLIIGTGCVTPITAPYGNLMAMRQAVEQSV